MRKSIISTRISKIGALMLAAMIVLTSFAGCSAGQKDCDHNYYLSNHKDASVTANGYKEYTCSECGNSYQEVIPAKEAVASSENGKEEADLTRKRSVNLFDLPVYSDEEVINGIVLSLSYSAEETDADGWKHTDCYRLCGAKTERWIRYDIGGKYSTVSGNLYDANSSGGSGWLEFYDGEDFLAATPKVDSETVSVEFEIDISGVEHLTVHFRATEPGTWMIADDIILAN